ncbi:MAG: D-alanyl-D-alanine carboxypeptidase [Candidatus Peribacteraceae bacterium]|nr:D-alanyl-D-alanine carboxypeptidase [Candidatus Peribacteraceae bacterium]
MESLHLLLSVFLMGLLPVAPGAGSNPLTIHDVPLSPPAIAAGKLFPGRSLAKGLSASGVTILDLQSGQELFARNADRRRSVGSLTKIMTAIIIAESHELNEIVVIPSDIAEIDGSTVRLPPGSRFTVGDLLSALLIASANDAADALARFHSGSDTAFVAEMNARAQMLGLANTSFANPSGLDDSAQWSTPRDIAWLAAFALRNPDIRSRMSTAHASIKSKAGHSITLEHTHALLAKGGAILAGKTGTTLAARQCLFTLIKEGEREYLVVLLGSNERYVDLRTVMRVLSSFFA